MSARGSVAFNPPPGWPKPPKDWTPPKGWKPDPSWPAPPVGWELWLPVSENPGGFGSAPSATTASTDSALHPREGVQDVDRENLDHRLALLEAENAALRTRLDAIGADANEVVGLDDERVLQDVGIYRYHHPLENAVAYKARLDDLATRIAQMIKQARPSRNRTCSRSMGPWPRARE